MASNQLVLTKFGSSYPHQEPISFIEHVVKNGRQKGIVMQDYETFTGVFSLFPHW